MTDLRKPKVQKILHSKAFAHLATIGPGGEPQSSPMWFVWDGEYLKFTHTTQRQNSGTSRVIGVWRSPSPMWMIPLATPSFAV
jgi:general stress protein 26